MKLVVQRVSSANVKVEGKVEGEIDKGLLVLLGIDVKDTKEDAEYLVKKLYGLRIFSDEQDKMNLSIKDVEGELLIISQFTLLADTSNGNRPSYTKAARPEQAIPIYEYFLEECNKLGIHVEHGIFGADMKVSLVNDGPVTILLEH